MLIGNYPAAGQGEDHFESLSHRLFELPDDKWAKCRIVVFFYMTLQIRQRNLGSGHGAMAAGVSESTIRLARRRARISSKAVIAYNDHLVFTMNSKDDCPVYLMAFDEKIGNEHNCILGMYSTGVAEDIALHRVIVKTPDFIEMRNRYGVDAAPENTLLRHG